MSTRPRTRQPHAWGLKTRALSGDLKKGLPRFVAPGQARATRSLEVFSGLVDAATYSGPATVDWRLSNALTPPRDQGPINSCTSCAVVGVVEALHFLQRHTRIRLAAGFIHTCLLGLDPQHGANPQDAIDAAAAHGIAYGFPGDYPYPPGHCATGNLYSIKQRVWLPGRNATLGLVASQGPVVADMLIDPSFLKLGPGQIYKAPPAGDLRLHSVALVGFDLNGQSWIVANSFGPKWGDAGFGLVAFASGGLVDDRGAWQIIL